MKLEESVASFQLNSSLIPGNIFNCHLELVLDSSDSGNLTRTSSRYNIAQCLCFHKININSEVSSHPALWQKQTKQNFFDLNCWVCVVFKWCFTEKLNKCSNWKCRTAAIIKFDVRLIFSTFTPKLGTKNNSSNFLISSGRNKKQKLILWSLLFLFSEKPL